MSPIQEQAMVSYARHAGLRYVSEKKPGIVRQRRGKSFVYLGLSGRPIRDAATLNRIRKLAIPPAYGNVWISPDPRGHIQATGRDQRGRKQYRYHPLWRQTRDADKFQHTLDFGKSLDRIRRHTRRHMRMPGLSREKILAAVVQLLEKTAIRIGNEEYARRNHSFGLTTFRNRHAKVRGSSIHFEFVGKHSIRHSVDLRDTRLARIVKKCQELPGQDLFEYIDENGTVHGIGSNDVNEYLKSITQRPFTAKDFRTWIGTVHAAAELTRFPDFKSEAEAKRQINRAVEAVAQKLGNTRAICRKSYIHPEILNGYLERQLVRINLRAVDSHGVLKASEKAVVRYLHARCSR